MRATLKQRVLVKNTLDQRKDKLASVTTVEKLLSYLKLLYWGYFLDHVEMDKTDLVLIL